MKKTFVFSLLMVLVILFLGNIALGDELADIQRGMKEKRAKWVA